MYRLVNDAIDQVEYKFYGIISNQDYIEARELIDIITSKIDETLKVKLVRGKDITLGNNASIRIASREGLIQVIHYCMEHGADLTVDDHYCLKWAVRMGYVHIVKYFISRGEEIEESHVIDSAVYGHVSMLRFLMGELPLYRFEIVDVIVAVIRTNRRVETLEILLAQEFVRTGPKGALYDKHVYKIFRVALTCGSIVVTSQLLTYFEKMNLLSLFEWDPLGVGDWFDGVEYLDYLFQQGLRVENAILIKILKFLLGLGAKPLQTILSVIDRVQVSYQQLLEEEYQTLCREVVPLITNVAKLEMLVPKGMENISKRIHKLETRAALIIQRAWKRYKGEDLTFWKRISKVNSFIYI